jgi:hypothetical protein
MHHHQALLPRRPGRRTLRAVLLVAAGAAACAPAEPTAGDLASEPVLAPLPGEVELGDVRVVPRRGRVGVPGRDGVVERVVAVAMAPAEAADLVQQRDGGRYAFRRVDLGGGSPVTVELRGTAPSGAAIVVTTSSGPPVPLYGGPDELRPLPPTMSTSVVITVISPQ